ncbi:hypothetical protein O3P69_003279 [Scylla paramamosain]|uniref:Uncharacterized protein n=1 Tax=Scylla paramamosain TaxID=85552 RepID=A0AAW0UNP9_SCYPA
MLVGVAPSQGAAGASVYRGVIVSLRVSSVFVCPVNLQESVAAGAPRKMKIIWVSLLLAGLCLAKEEEVADDLQPIEGRRLEMRAGDTPCNGCVSPEDKLTSSSVVVPSLDLQNLLGSKSDLLSSAISPDLSPEDLLLKLGNLVSYASSATDDKPLGFENNGLPLNIDENGIIGTLSTLLGIAGGLDGTAGKLGTFVSVVNVLKTSVLELGARGLELANFILAVIGLALLVGYVLASGGDLGPLAVDFTSSSHRSLSDNSAVESISNMVYDAINNFSY